MQFSSVLVINFFVLFLLFIWIFLFLLIISIFKEKSRVFDCQVFALVNLYVWVPFSDGLLFFFFQFIHFSIVYSFFFELLQQNFSLLFFLFFYLLFDVFLVLVLIELCPNDCFAERYDRIWSFDWDLAIDFFEIHDAFLKMYLSWSVQN